VPTSLLCNLEIDYTEVPGSGLPFKVALDLENSVITPEEGENQKFCYTITGVGSEDPMQKDLSQWVLGLCDEIAAGQVVKESIAVMVDETLQSAVFGDNVKLADPDSVMDDGPGLKFDFRLSKSGGAMSVSFELDTPHAVGPVPVSLKGACGEPVTGLNICGPVCEQPSFCEIIKPNFKGDQYYAHEDRKITGIDIHNDDIILGSNFPVPLTT